MRKILLVLVGAVIGVGAPVTAASLKEQTKNEGNTLASAPDWVAPVITSSRVIKSEGGKAGYVRSLGNYYVCADIAPDTGNPPSLLQSAKADLTSLVTGLLDQALGTTVATPCTPGTDDRQSGPHTVVTGALGGTITVTAQDNAGNTRTATPGVTVDDSRPTAVSFTATNGGATQNHPEPNDVMVFTFSEPIDPHSLIPGWDGAAERTGLEVRFVQAGNSDTVNVWRPNGAGWAMVPVTLTTGFTPWLSLGNNFVKANVTFTGSSITVSGSTVRVKLGSPNVANQTTTPGSTNATTWRSSPLVFDWAGNTPLLSQTITEGAPADPEF